MYCACSILSFVFWIFPPFCWIYHLQKSQLKKSAFMFGFSNVFPMQIWNSFLNKNHLSWKQSQTLPFFGTLWWIDLFQELFEFALNRTQFQNIFFRIVFPTFFGQWEKYFLKKRNFNILLRWMILQVQDYCFHLSFSAGRSFWKMRN